MAFDLPPLPFPKEPGTNNPYIATPDEAGGYVVPHGNYFKKKVGDINLWIPVSAEDPLPTENANIDVTLSALRNALLGTGNKTLTDLATALAPLETTEKQEELVSALGEILVQLQAGSPVSVTESVLPEGASTAEKQEALTALIGALDTAAVSDPAAAGAVIALLKGLLSRLQTLENKIDSFTTGEETVNTELKGSLVAVDGEVEITTPGVAQPLTAESILVDPNILLQMPDTNAGYVAVGSENPKIKLYPGDSIVIKCADTHGIYILGEIAGDKVLWLGGAM